MKVSKRLNHPVLSVGLYLAMGWLGLLTGRAMIDRIPTSGVLLARRRRHRLHRRRHLLRHRLTAPLRPPRLAPLRHGRNRLPRLRRTLARLLTNQQSRPGSHTPRKKVARHKELAPAAFSL